MYNRRTLKEDNVQEAEAVDDEKKMQFNILNLLGAEKLSRRPSPPIG